ncbi:Abi family protein [Rathayibacter sp. VKM Ac-2630]|uniref:Abi family protein n=1 Tax=Rathayibacter sp. VKM Ac-2630 TaxID=1938617 RepID=UPI001F36F819|nr:Abi family protein [Rathayibacter sp. VKM Ac-2630]
MLTWEGPFLCPEEADVGLKPGLSPPQLVRLLLDRGLEIADPDACARFLDVQGYYRFSGYLRYFQHAPHRGDDRFEDGSTFEAVRAVYDADALLRERLTGRLARAELLLRSRTAQTIAEIHGPYRTYLETSFYTDAPSAEPTGESCLRDIERSRERHILRYRDSTTGTRFDELPVWSAVEAWSFGTLSKCIERGDGGALSAAVAARLGAARSGFASRVRALVYLRNRCAHHSRLWNHSLIDAGPPRTTSARRRSASPASSIRAQCSTRSRLSTTSSIEARADFPYCPTWSSSTCPTQSYGEVSPRRRARVITPRPPRQLGDVLAAEARTASIR